MLGVIFPLGRGGNDDDANDDVASSSTMKKTKDAGVKPMCHPWHGGGKEDVGIALSPPSLRAVSVIVSHPPTDEDAVV